MLDGWQPVLSRQPRALEVVRQSAVVRDEGPHAGLLLPEAVKKFADRADHELANAVVLHERSGGMEVNAGGA